MLVILPFEQKWFIDHWQWEVSYVGHPLMEAIGSFKPTFPKLAAKPIVAVLPGSRKQEIKNKNYPKCLKASAKLPDYQFIVGMAPGIEEAFYKPFLQLHPNTSAVKGLTYELLAQAQAAVVTSGTATLETALFEVPEVVCYKGSAISYAIAKQLIKIKYISLVNLIMEKLVVKELIQQNMHAENITQELKAILQNGEYRTNMLDNYKQLKNKLQGKETASNLATKAIIELGKK